MNKYEVTCYYQGYSTKQVEVTTISLVLNDKANHIPWETKLIIAKAKEMGYRPNKMAVGLVKKQSNIIGFVLPDIRNQFFHIQLKF